MKGVIFVCMEELVVGKFGKDSWSSILKLSSLPVGTKFSTQQDIPESAIGKVIAATCNVTRLTHKQLLDAFGDYWATVFAPKLYRVYYVNAKNAKDFLKKMAVVHTTITKNMNASPPKFTYEEPDESTLIMEYSSARGMKDLMPSIILGIGKHYKEKLTVLPMGNKFKIHFS